MSTASTVLPFTIDQFTKIETNVLATFLYMKETTDNHITINLESLQNLILLPSAYKISFDTLRPDPQNNALEMQDDKAVNQEINRQLWTQVQTEALDLMASGLPLNLLFVENNVFSNLLKFKRFLDIVDKNTHYILKVEENIPLSAGGQHQSTHKKIRLLKYYNAKVGRLLSQLPI